MKNTTEETARIGYIADAITALVREAVLEKIGDVEAAAAAAAEDADEEDDRPPVAKLGVKIAWPAGQEEPEVEVTVSYSVRRSISLSGKADGKQENLNFPE